MSNERRDARADAAAEKARAKAMRPWFKKKRFIIPLGLIVLIVVLSLASPKDKAEKVGTTDTVARSEETTSTSAASGTVGSTAATATTEPKKTSFAVGDIVKRENLEIAVLQVNPNFKSSNEFLKPKPQTSGSSARPAR